MYNEEDNNFNEELNYDDNDDDIKSENKSTVIKKNKSKLIGKHSLTYDSIFKGERTQNISEDSEYIIECAINNFDVNDIDLEENRNNIDNYRETRLKEQIFDILKINTDINFNAPRRKPARTDFNAYFNMLIKQLNQYGYTKTEIFVELSGYFSDNIWLMFQLLEKKFSNIIITELKDKYGLQDINKINFL